jgi:hypothetical protein
VIGSNTTLALKKCREIELGLGLSEFEKFEVTIKVRKKDLIAVVGNE